MTTRPTTTAMAPAARARQSHEAGGAWQGAGAAAELGGGALEGTSVPGQGELDGGAALAGGGAGQVHEVVDGHTESGI
jgi:hypothetical protein